MPEKILFITNKLRPNNNAEAFQSTMIAKYISAGFKTHVLSTGRSPTGIGESVHHFVQLAADRSLGARIESIYSRFGRNRRFTFPDSHTGWVDEAVRTVSELIRNERIGILMTRSMPASTHMIGLKLKSAYPEITWIASMSDPISINPYHRYSSRKLRMRVENFEKMIFKNADMVTHTNRFVIEEYGKKYSPLGGKHTVLTNMFDRDDVPLSRTIKSGDGRMVLTYAGRLYGPRSPETLFRGVRKFLDTAGRNRLVLNLVGVGLSRQLDSLVRRYGLGDAVRVHPFMEPGALAKLLSSSHLLVTIDGDFPGRNIFSPSKNMDYLAMTVPILGITRIGPTAELLDETGSGFWAEPEDVAGIVEFLSSHFDRVKAGYEFTPNHERVMDYHCRNVLDRFMAKVSEAQGYR